MNVKSIIIGALATGVVFSGGMFVKIASENSDSVYTPRQNSIEQEVRGHDGHAAYLDLLRNNPLTGTIDPNDFYAARNQALAKNKVSNKTQGLVWENMGPDNVGGRTRAVLVDVNNSNIIYAGSVTGGLFVSYDKGGTWATVPGTNLGENLAVSCIAQRSDGRIFVGTGSSFEGVNGTGSSGALGNGLYEYVPASGNIIPLITAGGTASIPNNNTSHDWSIINQIEIHGNRIYVATKAGLKWAEPDGSDNYPTTDAGWTNPIHTIQGSPNLETGNIQDVDVASNGKVLVSMGGQIYVSDDGSDDSFAKQLFAGGRLESAIAPSDVNIMYIVAASPCLTNIYRTANGGTTWDTVVPGGSPTIDPFANLNPDNTYYNCQGGYDNSIAINPTDPYDFIVGGVKLFRWTSGSWRQVAHTAQFLGEPFYVHADKHRIVWQDANTIYIGSDGGIARILNASSADVDLQWTQNNFGYNTLSLYSVSTSANGYILGGAQDNGCQLYDKGDFGATFSPKGSIEILGGDGFATDFSNFGTGIAFASSQYGSVRRSVAGGAMAEFWNNELTGLCGNGQECGSFYTLFRHWEDRYHYATTPDSIEVTFPFDTTYNAGDILWYQSLTNSMDIPYMFTTTTSYLTTDTIMLPDPVQSKFVFAEPSNNTLYLTRDAARLNASSITWSQVAGPSSSPHSYNSGSQTTAVEFSADGNYLFAGCANGRVYRIDTLNGRLGKPEHDIRNGADINCTMIANFAPRTVTGIAIDPKDPANVIVTLGNYGYTDYIHMSTNAKTATDPNDAAFVSIQGPALTTDAGYLPRMPIYDAEIDLNDSNIVIIGTEWGVWATSNAFSGNTVEWYDESTNGMAHVPVFEVRQQILPWDQAVNYERYYLGTHGRGFYQSTSRVVSVEEDGGITDSKSVVNSLSVFPNPVSDNTTLSFRLAENTNAKVKVYNLTGTLVKEIDLGSLNKGSRKVKLNATDLAAGTYIVSLEAGDSRTVSKFVVSK